MLKTSSLYLESPYKFVYWYTRTSTSAWSLQTWFRKKSLWTFCKRSTKFISYIPEFSWKVTYCFKKSWAKIKSRSKNTTVWGKISMKFLESPWPFLKLPLIKKCNKYFQTRIWRVIKRIKYKLWNRPGRVSQKRRRYPYHFDPAVRLLWPLPRIFVIWRDF